MWVCSLPGAGVEENWGKGVVADRVDWLHKSKCVHNGDQKSGQDPPQAFRHPSFHHLQQERIRTSG